MWALHVTIDVKPGCEAQFDEWKRVHADLQKASPGFLRSTTIRSQSNPSRYYYISFWESEAHAQALTNGDLFRAAFAKHNPRGLMDLAVDERCDVVVDEFFDPSEAASRSVTSKSGFVAPLLEERVVTSDGVAIQTYHLQTPGATKRALLVHGVSYGGPSIFDARIPATVTSVTTTHPAGDAASSPSPSGRGQGEGPLPAVAERSSASEDTSGSVMAQLSARLCEPWTLDIRGYGKSDHPADGRTANGANAQLDIDAAVRRILGGHYGANDPTRGRLILVGYSWGGRTALQYASDHPDLVERLILIAPAAWSPEKGPNYRQQRDAMIPPDDGGGYVTQTAERFKSRLRKYPDDDPRVIDSWLERAIAHDPRSPLGAFYDYDDMPPGPMSDLSKITMPLRIVVGKDDPIYQPYYQELLNRSATTDKALIEVPDTDHWWMLHATRARFAQEIVAAALD